jgi:ubiquinone/menaquinone biosynthesis C-methylase UbiE
MAIDYGIDSPQTVKDMFWRAGTFAALGIGIFAMNKADYPGPAMTLMVLFVIAGIGFLAAGFYLRWSSQVAKLKMRDTLLDKVQWTGDEKVLDVGCGRGLLAIGAAKRLKKGRVTGIDVWDGTFLSGNKLDAAVENAKAEGVADRVKIENGNALKLTYGDKSFDVVVSSLAVNTILEAEARAEALHEMMRVLKPGGQIAVFDVSTAGEYAAVLREAGAESVDDSHSAWLGFAPGRFVVARKRA